MTDITLITYSFDEFSVISGFPGNSAGKESAAMQEMWVQSLGGEDPLEKGIVFLPGESPWTEEPGGLQSMKSQSWTQVSN